jgi:hypothetical protein
MTSPSGSEQALSLVWALENVANFSHEDSVVAISEVFGIGLSIWEKCMDDPSWFVGDPRWHSREHIETKWNERFAILTTAWLDEDVWHAPLWQLWLKDSKMVFAANLVYLIKVGGHGTVVRLAKFVGRNRTTASKWGRWQDEGRKVRVPPVTVLPKIIEFFDLKPSCDLYKEPLFLGRSGIQDSLLRIQGKYYLDCLSGEHLNQAVDRLRVESARQATRTLDGTI